MKRLVLSVIFTAAVAAAGCGSAPDARETTPAAVAAPTAKVTATDMAVRFETGGVVRARATALIASRVLAPIAQVHVRPGDRVRKGDPLITLDAREAGANRARAGAAMTASLESARAAEDEVRSADAALVLARATHDRMSALHAKRSATTQELDQAVAALGGAEAHAASARAQLAAANASRDAAQAAAEGAGIAASYAVLAAPFDGVVTDRHADAGTMAVPGVQLMTVEDPSAYQLETLVDEARSASIAVGQHAWVRLDAADHWAETQVIEIARVDPASHTFLVKIAMPSAAGSRSGAFGRARFEVAARRTLTLPVSAIVRRGQLTFVFRVDADGTARLRPIAPGSADENVVEVLAGLGEGDTVVAAPPPSLQDGTRIAGSGK